jgi:phage terminase small subunit
MLTPKQIRFVEEYLVDLNAKQAAIRAGYSAHSAESQSCKLLALAKVSQEIKVRQDALSQSFKVTREDLVKDLVYIKNKQKDAFPPSAIAAIKEIGKFLGLYEPDKVEHSGIPPIQINLIKPEDESDKDETEED